MNSKITTILIVLLYVPLNLFYAQINPICNSGFESDLTNWNPNINNGAVSFSNETVDVYKGSNSLKAIVNTADTWKNRIESCDISLSNAHTYKFSFFAKTISGVSGDLKILIKDRVSATNLKVTINNIRGTDWKEYSYTYKADADYTAYLRISFMDIKAYLLDEIRVVDISYLDCHGDLNGLAYIDNCNVCVGGNTGLSSVCTDVKLSGVSRTFDEAYFGFNAKNIGQNNFRKDPNILNAWKKTNAIIYRYPGGTFGNSFDWHTGTTIIGGRPPQVNPPITPDILVDALPAETEILWMANIRVPTPSTGYDWRTLSRAELLSKEVLQAKTQDILDGLAAFEDAGKAVKYLELGNEFYFSDNEGLGEEDGAGGDGGNFQGDHFPYDNNPAIYISQMGVIAKAIKEVYPSIQIAVINCKSEGGSATVWNGTVNETLESDAQLSANIDALTKHWYQPDVWYDSQNSVMPPITDEASTKTALGFAFDYVNYKRDNDLTDMATGKELWITEGDIHDPSDNGTWLEGIREGIIQLAYVLMEQITMHTPHMFQPSYVDSDLKLTAKGKVASMIYAAGKNMTLVEELDLGGGYFNGQYGGPYPDLAGLKFSDGNKERFILINCSEKKYRNLNLSPVISNNDLQMFHRANSAPWLSTSPNEIITPLKSSELTIEPYSITILAEEDVINSLIEFDFIVSNPSDNFPDNSIKIYGFEETIDVGETMVHTLEIKNNGTSSITFDTKSLSFLIGSDFSVTQLSGLTVNPGSSVSFQLQFKPTDEGEFNDVLRILTTDGCGIEVSICGTASNSDKTSLDELNTAPQVFISPTVFSQEFKVNINDFDGNEELKLYDLSGELCYQVKLNSGVSKHIPDVRTGVYVVIIISKQSVYKSKLIKYSK